MTWKTRHRQLVSGMVSRCFLNYFDRKLTERKSENSETFIKVSDVLSFTSIMTSSTRPQTDGEVVGFVSAGRDVYGNERARVSLRGFSGGHLTVSFLSPTDCATMALPTAGGRGASGIFWTVTRRERRGVMAEE